MPTAERSRAKMRNRCSACAVMRWSPTSPSLPLFRHNATGIDARGRITDNYWDRKERREPMRLGERLLRARTERGWRQGDIAQLFGVNQATICRAERGDSPSGVAARFIEMQLDKLEHDNPLPVVGSGEPPTGSAEEAAMPRGTKTGTGTRAKRTSQKRAQSGNQNYQGLPASHQKQLEQFGKKFGNLQ